MQILIVCLSTYLNAHDGQSLLYILVREIHKHQQRWTIATIKDSTLLSDVLTSYHGCPRFARWSVLSWVSLPIKWHQSVNTKHTQPQSRHIFDTIRTDINLQHRLCGQTGLCRPGTKKVRRSREQVFTKLKKNCDKHRHPRLTLAPTAPGTPGTPWRAEQGQR